MMLQNSDATCFHSHGCEPQPPNASEDPAERFERLVHNSIAESADAQTVSGLDEQCLEKTKHQCDQFLEDLQQSSKSPDTRFLTECAEHIAEEHVHGNSDPKTTASQSSPNPPDPPSFLDLLADNDDLLRDQHGSFQFPEPAPPPFLDLSDGDHLFLEELFYNGDTLAPHQVGDYLIGDMNEFLALNAFQYNQGKPPASEDAIKQLSTKTLSKDAAGAMAAEVCAVCQYSFRANEEVTCLPCGHNYHKDCVTRWLSLHCTCPVCREEVRAQAEVCRNTHSSDVVDVFSLN